MSFLSRLRTSSRPVTTFPDMTEPRLFPSQERRCPDFPFIPVTGAVTEDCAIEIRASGAKDYVLKAGLHRGWRRPSNGRLPKRRSIICTEGKSGQKAKSMRELSFIVLLPRESKSLSR